MRLFPKLPPATSPCICLRRLRPNPSKAPRPGLQRPRLRPSRPPPNPLSHPAPRFPRPTGSWNVIARSAKHRNTRTECAAPALPTSTRILTTLPRVRRPRSSCRKPSCRRPRPPGLTPRLRNPLSLSNSSQSSRRSRTNDGISRNFQRVDSQDSYLEIPRRGDACDSSSRHPVSGVRHALRPVLVVSGVAASGDRVLFPDAPVSSRRSFYWRRHRPCAGFPSEPSGGNVRNRQDTGRLLRRFHEPARGRAESDGPAGAQLFLLFLSPVLLLGAVTSLVGGGAGLRAAANPGQRRTECGGRRTAFS